MTASSNNHDVDDDDGREPPVDDAPSRAELERTLTRLESEVSAYGEIIADLESDLTAERERREQLEQELETVREENRQLRHTVADLEERLQFLGAVQEHDQMDASQRAAYLVFGLLNKAEATGREKVSYDKDDALDRLDYSIHRTSVYDVFEKAEQLVGEPDVVRYCREDRGSEKPSRLVLDRSNGELPSSIGGVARTTVREDCGDSTTSETAAPGSEPRSFNGGDSTRTD